MRDIVRILLVDDHALLRDSFERVLGGIPGFQVVGTADNADDAIGAVMQCDPDIVLMDIDMPGMICFDAAQRIGDMRPETRVVFLSAFHHDYYIEQALKVNARGYVVKSETPEKVVEAIERVAGGGVFYSQEVLNRIVADTRGVRLGDAHRTRVSTLSNREMEVLRYIARGLAKKQIAGTMHVAVKTVDGHVTRLMSKLDIHDRVELARFAIRERLVEA